MTYNSITILRQHLCATAWRCCLAFMAAMLLTACENTIQGEDEETEPVEEGYARITIKGAVADTDYDTGTRAGDANAVVLTDELCSRFDIAIYKDGERIIRVAQKAGDSDFGQFTADLAIDSTYQIVAIAHSCENAMTTTDIHKITAGREVTDMFWACETITPTADVSIDITLHRIVAKVLFHISEPTPSAVTSMYFFYTGGSSTFDGETGLGSVASKQSVTLEVPSDAYTYESEYTIYTIPRSDSNTLNLTVAPFKKNGDRYKTVEFTNVKIQQNHITRYSGKFFTEDPNTDPDPDNNKTASKGSFYVVTEWGGTTSYSY